MIQSCTNDQIVSLIDPKILGVRRVIRTSSTASTAVTPVEETARAVIDGVKI